jgi:tetratricopeptide (TPR) repeat protein
MSSFDARGLAVTAADAEALALYEAAVESLQGQRGDTAARTAAALAHDPRLAAAYCLRAALLVLSGTAASQHPLAATLRVLDDLTIANDRERRHAAAARAWLDGNVALALERYAAIVVDYPRDGVALQVAHALDFRLGHREMLRDRIAEVLPHWDPSVPGYGYVLGMHAFGLEENGDYARAEAAARESLHLAPDNAGAIHVVAHVMEMQGRAREGVEWLEATREIWASNAGFSTHLAWHLALFHIDLDASAPALAIYVDVIAPRAGNNTAALIDATALLWRLELRGSPVRRLWRSLANHWAQSSLAGERAFTLVHALLAFAAAGVEHRAARVAKLLRNDPATRAANTVQDLALAVPLAEGLQAYGRGDYATAVDRITAVRAVAYRCGGSIAQCDLIHLTLVEAALRAQRMRLALALAAERAARKPASPLNRWLCARAEFGAWELSTRPQASA